MTDSDLTRTYRRYLASVVRFHLAAAEAGGLGPTDYQAASLIDLDGPLSAGELADQLGLSPSATTRVVDRLVSTGLAERIDDAGDRRRRLIAHTGHLPGALSEVLGQVREPIGTAIAELDDHQRAGLQAYFRAATKAYLAVSPRHAE